MLLIDVASSKASASNLAQLNSLCGYNSILSETVYSLPYIGVMYWEGLHYLFGSSDTSKPSEQQLLTTGKGYQASRSY